MLTIEEIQGSELYLWLAAHPDWIAISILLIAFAESFAIVGIVVPGVLFLYIAAFLGGSGLLSWPACLLMAFFGAVLGDGLSYLLGRHYRERVWQWPVLRNDQQWRHRGENFIHNHGIKSIVAGRFIGPIRPIMPLIAGTLAMPTGRFFMINVLSAIAWAPVYIVPGYSLGAALDMPLTSTQLAAIAILILVAVGGFFYGIRRWFYAGSNNGKAQ